jgi:hypothetical protein
MEQLLIHLFGDYVTQTDWMARTKTQKFFAAFVHATIYSIPFVLLTQSPVALFVIWFTHLLIDHYRLARYVVFAKNWITDTTLKWSDCSGTGYHKDSPAWLSTWLLIIVDNFMHLAINYSAIRWLSFMVNIECVLAVFGVIVFIAVMYVLLDNPDSGGYT